jgi:membrane-associated HD superfamily phosphohydrolase
MDEYETTKSIISLLPVAVIAVLSVSLIKVKWPLRLLIVFFVGWVAIFYSTQLFWDYSFEYAPTDEIKKYVASRDGGARVGSLIFGWVYVLIIMLAMEAIMFILGQAARLLFEHNKAN